MANRREQAVKDYGRGRSQAYRFEKRSEPHSTRKPRGDEDAQAIADDLAAWGLEDEYEALTDEEVAYHG